MKLFCDFEYGKDSVFTDLGCSPESLGRLCDWLRGMKGSVEKLSLAMYLFNNRELYKVLKELSECGCETTIYSIPLEGYDHDKPAPVFSHNSGRSIGCLTKYDLARTIYEEIRKSVNGNLHLRIVPHMYLRSESVNPFSRGNMPYSLHCKTICIQCYDGTVYAGLTSSNMAVRDAQKIELVMLRSLCEREKVSAWDFYSGLYENSIDINEFDEIADYSHFQIVLRPVPAESRLMYIAPFYDNSAVRFEKIISSIVKKARHRVIVCAQHISAYQYSYQNQYVDGRPGQTVRDGFLSDVLERADHGVSTRFLSQTYVDEHGSHKCRKPMNSKSFVAFAAAAKKHNCNYYVNKNVHSKFMVIDDMVLITTCNFTPTQFIYLPKVHIPNFVNMPDYSYSGIHCEFGVYSIIEHHDFAEKIVSDFEQILNLDDTRKMF